MRFQAETARTAGRRYEIDLDALDVHGIRWVELSISA